MSDRGNVSNLRMHLRDLLKSKVALFRSCCIVCYKRFVDVSSTILELNCEDVDYIFSINIQCGVTLDIKDNTSP